MTDTATAAAETPVTAPVSDTTSPPHPAQPGETPANDATPGAVESNAQNGSGAGEPAAAKPEDGQQGEGTEKKKSRYQEDFDRLTTKRREAERRAAAAEARAAELMRQLQPPGPNATYEDEQAFLLRKAVREERVGDLQNEAFEAKEQAWESVKEAVSAKVAAVSDRMPDLYEKLRALPVLSSATVAFMAESEKGAEIGFFLANNEREAARIASLPPLHQGIELARLEGKLSVAPQIRKVSTAPSPPPTVTGNPSPASRDPHEMSQEEYNAWYRKRNKRG
jgi:hypothetical protein